MWVVKIGGSLLTSDRLRGWLDAIACYGPGNVVVVPGGGAFADQVRASQQHWGYGDAAAHHMALLAMEQYGVMLTGLRADLAVARSVAAVFEALDAARVPVWLPRDMVLAERALPACWELTSDSLAVWLAQALGASRVLLVKSAGLPPGEGSCESLTRSAVVDPLFCDYLRRAGIDGWVCGPDAHAGLRAALYADSGFGTHLNCAHPEPAVQSAG